LLIGHALMSFSSSLNPHSHLQPSKNQKNKNKNATVAIKPENMQPT